MEESAIKTDINTPVNWEAQDYVEPGRSPVWYAIFVAVTMGLIAVDIFFIKSWTFSALVVVMAVALMVYIKRPARTETYGLSVKQGIYIGERLYHFEEFRAFGVINDDGRNSIMLLPTKRFSAGVSVYFPDELGEQIVDIIGQRLPMEELKLDPIDVLIRKLHL